MKSRDWLQMYSRHSLSINVRYMPLVSYVSWNDKPRISPRHHPSVTRPRSRDITANRRRGSRKLQPGDYPSFIRDLIAPFPRANGLYELRVILPAPGQFAIKPVCTGNDCHSRKRGREGERRKEEERERQQRSKRFFYLFAGN